MGGIYNSRNLQTYHYAGNNPLKYTDPSGQDYIGGVSKELRDFQEEQRRKRSANEISNPQDSYQQFKARNTHLDMVHAANAGLVIFGLLLAIPSGGASLGLAIAGLTLYALEETIAAAESKIAEEGENRLYRSLLDALEREKELRYQLLEDAAKFEEAAKWLDKEAEILDDMANNTTDKSTADGLKERAQAHRDAAQTLRDNAQTARNAANKGTKPEE